MKLTQERLKQLLHYSPDDGQFRRLTAGRGFKVGQVAGCRRKDGYVTVMVDKQAYLAHRLAFLYVTGEFPVEHTDHVNGDPSDNRWVNLREATCSQNMHNVCMRTNNSSGYKGVAWSKSAKKWRAMARFGGVYRHIGYFNDIVDAAEAYQDFVSAPRGEFHRKT